MDSIEHLAICSATGERLYSSSTWKNRGKVESMTGLLRTICAILTISAIGCSSQTSGPAAVPSTGSFAAKSRQRFSSPEGKFSVEFPGTPQRIQLGDQIFYAVELPSGGAFSVTWADHTQFPRPTLEETLIMARDAVVGSKKVLKDDVIKIAGNPGREFAFVEANGNAVHVQAFIVGKRVYQLSVGCKSENYSLHSKDREHFLKSFQLAE